MGVTLERVQNKFACIIGELCSEPDILSQFAIWVDLRIAEYKAKGAISLDCTGTNPDPNWLRGHKPSISPGRKLARHKKPGFDATENSSFENSPVGNPEHAEWSVDPVLEANIVAVKEEEEQDSEVFPVSLHTNRLNHSKRTESRKRPGNQVQDPPCQSKSSRLSTSSNTSASGINPVQDSASNQSFLSVIGVTDQPSVSDVTMGMQQTTDNTSLSLTSESDTNRGDNSADYSFNTTDDQIIYQQSASELSQIAIEESAHSPSLTANSVVGRNIVYTQPVNTGKTIVRFTVEPSPFDQRRVPPDSESTLKNTRYAVTTFERWLIVNHQDFTKMEEIQPSKLDAYLVEFFTTAKRSTGEEYRAGSIRLLRERFERHLKLHGYPHSLVHSKVFTKSQQAFKERKRQLKDMEN